MEGKMKHKSVLRKAIFFFLLYIILFFAANMIINNVVIHVTGIAYFSEIPLFLLWFGDMAPHLITVLLTMTLLFSPIEQRKVLAEDKDKLLRVIIIVFGVLLVLLTFWGVMSGIAMSLYGVLHVITYIALKAAIFFFCYWYIKRAIDKYYKEPEMKKNLLTTGEICMIGVAVLVVVVYIVSPRAHVITTGQFGQGSDENTAFLVSILGAENTEDKFNLYFFWHNVVHELGHSIIIANADTRPHIVDEEQLVNDFSIAFWATYGEAGLLDELQSVVTYALENFERPVDEDTTHIEYALRNWGLNDFLTFNNYGWFQFSMVNESLNNVRSLEEVLADMGIENITVQEAKTLVYDEINEETVPKIIADTVSIMRDWGVYFPAIYHRFSTDPNNNSVLPTKNIYGILDRLHTLVVW